MRSPSECCQSDALTAAVASAVYRGCAVPVARVVMPGNKKGGRIDPAVESLKLPSVAKPKTVESHAVARLASAHEAGVPHHVPPLRRALDARQRPD